MELNQNLWERYGFHDNPFDTRALSLNPQSELSVSVAYIERGANSAASTILTNFLRNPGGGRIVVEGDPGIGKTTFVNYHRYRWESKAKKKILTPFTEISVQEYWNVDSFLLSLLSSILSRLRLDMKKKDFQKDQLLTEISAITGVLVKKETGISGNVTVLGTGGGFGKNSGISFQIGDLTTEHLREYLQQLVQKIVKELDFSGVIIHLNNLELLAKDGITQLKNFFNTVRDYLQVENIYYIFVGFNGLFQQVITPLERVRSIFFDQPVYLEPLAIEQVKKIIDKRYKILAIPGKRWVKPVEDDVIDFLYKIYSGKIRYVMNAITTLITLLPETYAGSLDVNQAVEFLRSVTENQVKRHLSETEFKIYQEALKLGRFTNSSLVLVTGKTKQYLQKVINRFLELNFIYLVEKKGRNSYYEIEPRFSILVKINKNRKPK